MRLWPLARILRGLATVSKNSFCRNLNVQKHRLSGSRVLTAYLLYTFQNLSLVGACFTSYFHIHTLFFTRRSLSKETRKFTVGFLFGVRSSVRKNVSEEVSHRYFLDHGRSSDLNVSSEYRSGTCLSIWSIFSQYLKSVPSIFFTMRSTPISFLNSAFKIFTFSRA